MTKNMHNILNYLLDIILVIFIFTFSKVYLFAVSLFIKFEALHEFLVSIKDVVGIIFAVLCVVKVLIEIKKALK